MHVLLLEDEKKIADFIVAGFEASGFQIHHEADGFRGLNTALIRSFDAIVMDVNLPLMDGFQVLTEIRRKGLYTPVVLLTARTDLADRLKAFELGTDDYLPKPFEPRELVARLQTVLRRRLAAPPPLPAARPDTAGRLLFDGLLIDAATRSVQRLGQPVALTSTEFDLLHLLARDAGRVFHRDDILNQLRGHEADLYSRAVDILISRLRKKLEPLEAIKTLRHAGYALALARLPA